MAADKFGRRRRRWTHRPGPGKRWYASVQARPQIKSEDDVLVLVLVLVWWSSPSVPRDIPLSTYLSTKTWNERGTEEEDGKKVGEMIFSYRLAPQLATASSPIDRVVRSKVRTAKQILTF